MTIQLLDTVLETPAVDWFPLYQKINTLWKRDGQNKVITGDYASREFEDLRYADWTWTEKIDGTNIRLGWDGFGFTIGGRTNNAVFSPTVYKALHEVAEQITPKMRELFPAQFVVIYGEGYGAGIQKGGGYRSTPGFIAFDARVGDFSGFPPNAPMLSGRKFSELTDELGLDRVQVLGSCNIVDAWSLMLARYFHSTFEGVALEGIVGRPENGYYKRNGDVLSPIICKMKYKDIDDLGRE
jgi:hypothetical protein